MRLHQRTTGPCDAPSDVVSCMRDDDFTSDSSTLRERLRMWKKEDAQSMELRPEVAPSFERAAPVRSSNDRATIGRSITIKGEVKGDEDLLIQGKVEGSVTLKEHAVTVGPEGEVKADIGARVITIEGKVDGNLSAQEQVILRTASRVQGNITSPRVVLEDGARFRGGVDMSETPGEATPVQASTSGGRSAQGSAKTPSGNASVATDRAMSAPGGDKDTASQIAARTAR
jgi:cytoskeletal protein CcmA (bactofilin family)